MKEHLFLISLLSTSIVLVLGLSGCFGQSSPASAPPPSTGISNPQPTQPPPTIPPTIVAAHGGQGVVLTLANSDRSVTVKHGAVIMLALDETFYSRWTITYSDPTFLSPLTGVAAPPHTQGLYTASKTGQVTITAKGEPRCRTANPPCQLDPRPIMIQIIVQ